MNGNAKWVQWILGILIMIAMAMSSYAVNKIDKKVDLEQYRQDIQEMKVQIQCIYNWHLTPDLRK